MQTVQLYSRVSPAWLLVLVAKFGIGAAMAIAAVVNMSRNGPSQSILIFGALSLVVIGFALYDVAKLTERGVKITLSAEGLLDHRSARPVLLPWQAIDSMFLASHGGIPIVTIGVKALDLSPFKGPGLSRDPLKADALKLRLEYIDISLKGFEAMVHRFAPHILISSLTRRPHPGTAPGPESGSST